MQWQRPVHIRIRNILLGRVYETFLPVGLAIKLESTHAVRVSTIVLGRAGVQINQLYKGLAKFVLSRLLPVAIFRKDLGEGIGNPDHNSEVKRPVRLSPSGPKNVVFMYTDPPAPFNTSILRYTSGDPMVCGNVDG